jgi:hypothetical protein
MLHRFCLNGNLRSDLMRNGVGVHFVHGGCSAQDARRVRRDTARTVINSTMTLVTLGAEMAASH